MPRQSITFTQPQLKWLRDVSDDLGVSVGELVRRIVDDKRGGKYLQRQKILWNWQSRLNASAKRRDALQKQWHLPTG